MPRKVAQKAGLPSDSSGYTTWQTSSNITTGGDLSELSKFDNNASKFSHTVKIEHDDAFRLQALTITEGALKGRKVLMLEPVATEYFRFLDLPPEIRNMIYIQLLKEEDERLCIITYKAKNRARRAVRSTFHSKAWHTGMTWDNSKGNWIGILPSAYAILRSSKQILQEAGPIAYDRIFGCYDFPVLRTFLEGIGSMRKFLRSIALTGYGYHKTVVTTTLHKLKDAKNLTSLTFRESFFRQDQYGYKSVTVHKLVQDCMPLLKVLKKAQTARKSQYNVLDFVKITGPHIGLCEAGRDGKDCKCSYSEYNNCKNVLARMTRLNAELRSLLGKQLGTNE